MIPERKISSLLVCYCHIIYFATSAQRHPRIQLVQERDRSATPLLLFSEQLPHVSASNASLDEADEGLIRKERVFMNCHQLIYGIILEALH